MKKIILICFAATSLIFKNTSTYSQSLKNTTVESSYGELTSSTGKMSKAKFIMPVPDEFKKAAKTFSRDYKNITDAKWFKLSKGFAVVHFTKDDIKTMILYNKRGTPETMFRYYSEDKLAFEIRHLVKSNYYDYSIFNVIEAHIGDKISYLVKMEDKTSWKTIKVVDGEMEVVEEYAKR